MKTLQGVIEHEILQHYNEELQLRGKQQIHSKWRIIIRVRKTTPP